MPDIDNRNYTQPGAYIPGGSPDVVYVTVDTIANITDMFPAADFISCKARAVDLGSDVVSNGVDWVTDNIASSLGYTPEDTTNKVVDFSTINDTMYPTVKAVDDRITAHLGPAINESFTLHVVPSDTYIDATAVERFKFRLPYAFNITQVRAYYHDYVGILGYLSLQMKKNGIIDMLSTNLTIDINEPSSVTASVQPVFAPGAGTCAVDDEISFNATSSPTLTRGLSVILIGTRL
jgi:hypothetical protein